MIWFLLCINRLCLQNAMLFQQHNSFSTLIVLFLSVPWHCYLSVRRGIWPVKKLWVCLLVVTIWLELCTSYSSSCHHHLLVLISNKIQNGDILVSANPGLPGKWLLKRREETWLFFQSDFNACFFLLIQKKQISSWSAPVLEAMLQLSRQPNWASRFSFTVIISVLCAWMVAIKLMCIQFHMLHYCFILPKQISSQIITINKPTASFLQAIYPSCRPTKSVKALKRNTVNIQSGPKSQNSYFGRRHGPEILLEDILKKIYLWECLEKMQSSIIRVICVYNRQFVWKRTTLSVGLA